MSFLIIFVLCSTFLEESLSIAVVSEEKELEEGLNIILSLLNKLKLFTF